MARDPGEAIVRRPNGSIDTDFYVRRSARLRREAFAAAPGILRKWLAKLVARSGTGLRRLGGAGPRRNITVR
jgi:hypothetical protein